MYRYVFILVFGTTLSFGQLKVAVTVDDLPLHGMLPPSISRIEVTRKILSILKAHQVPEVVGFMNAGKLEQDAALLEVLKLWRSAGYPLGNHSYAHKDLNQISIEDFKTEISKNEPLLAELNGPLNWHFFRYPFLREGDTYEKRAAIRETLHSRGYEIAQVTIDFEDWSWNNPYARCVSRGDTVAIEWLKKSYLQNALDMLDRAEIMSQALFKRSMAHILLLHAGAFDSEMLDDLLKNYEKQGVEFIGLSEAVLDPAYAFDPKIVAKYGSEFTFQVMKSRGLQLKDLGLAPYENYPEKRLSTVCL